MFRVQNRVKSDQKQLLLVTFLTTFWTPSMPNEVHSGSEPVPETGQKCQEMVTSWTPVFQVRPGSMPNEVVFGPVLSETGSKQAEKASKRALSGPKHGKNRGRTAKSCPSQALISWFPWSDMPWILSNDYPGSPWTGSDDRALMTEVNGKGTLTSVLWVPLARQLLDPLSPGLRFFPARRARRVRCRRAEHHFYLVYPRIARFMTSLSQVPDPYVFLQGFSVDFVKKAAFSLIL